MTADELMTRKLSWSKVSDPEHPFRAQVDGHTLTIRLNDFPEEPMYSLLIDGKDASDFDDWPKIWSRPS
ncbi:hypothetical protein JY651_50940 [Pyxidicoccus parkwayensis]|uniref:Uncharacterized protein n=1 Tax=Pyxidicoccus parkwayensis TaxID=2813578 RepID=A0ABX7NY33_9BACT|nr:hypothetical protein [Pyxidicoccus parkwaysis]QSQ23304.1 hypothetical protein JY651_50940 [Pyxidicoccus parkwaysis]